MSDVPWEIDDTKNGNVPWQIDDVSNESSHIVKLGKTLARMPFELGRSLHKLTGTPTRENPIPSQGPGYNLASDIALTAIPSGAAAGIAGKLVKGPGLVKTVLRSAAAGGAGGGVGAALTDQPVAESMGLGAVLGPVIAGMGHLGIKSLTGLRNALMSSDSRASQMLHEMFGDRAPHVIEKITGTSPTVKGEVITTGKLADPTVPELRRGKTLSRRKVRDMTWLATSR